MIRRGAKVRYIGDRYEYAKGQVFTVRKKTHSLIELSFPQRYLGGEIHRMVVAMPISEFEEVK
jgi:hypothetical protein